MLHWIGPLFRFANAENVGSRMCQLVDGANVVQSGPSLNTKSTPIHGFTILYQFYRARHIIDTTSRIGALSSLICLDKLSERYFYRGDLSTSLPLCSGPSNLTSLSWLITAWIDFNASLRILYVFPTHQMALIHILAYIYQVACLI